MVICIKDHGLIWKEQEIAKLIILMVIHMKEECKTIWDLDQVYTNIKMVLYMMATGKRIKNQGKVNFELVNRKRNILGIGWKIKRMDKELWNIQMVINIQENGKMIKDKDRAL